MVKDNFVIFLENNISCLNLNDQISALEEISKMTSNLNALLIKDKFFCGSCEKYSEQDQVKEISKTEVCFGKCVYTDAGYGDDDRIADVTLLNYYKVCPICKKETFINGCGLSKANERRRR